MKGDKVVAFCYPSNNVIAPFVTAPNNRTESVSSSGKNVNIAKQVFVRIYKRKVLRMDFSNTKLIAFQPKPAASYMLIILNNS